MVGGKFLCYLYSVSPNLFCTFPQIASLEQKQIKNGINLTILDAHKKVIREQRFRYDQEIELLGTIVEWASEIIDFYTKHEQYLQNFKNKKI